MTKRIFILGIVIISIVAACSPAATPTEEPAVVPTVAPPPPTSDLTEVPVDEIINITWQWVAHTETTPAFQGVVPDPENYTLAFFADGIAKQKADCNMASGGYTVSGMSMTFSPGPMTLAECGPDSLSSTYLLMLGQTGSFGMKDGDLYLVSEDNNTRMQFRNAGPVEITEVVQNDPATLLGEPDGVDDFANANNWSLFDTACFTSTITGGQYVMTAHGETGACWEFSWPEIDDFYLDTTIEMPASCNADDRFGVIIGSPDNDQGYLYGIDCGGSYTLSLWDGVETTVLIPQTSSPHIQTDPGVRNRLGVALTSGNFYLYMNGEYLNQTQDYTFMGEGKLGFFVRASIEDEGFTVRFDEIKLWSLEDTFYPPEAELPDYPTTDIPDDEVSGANLSANVNVNVRSGPGTQFRVIAIALQGDSGDAMGTSLDGGWWAVPLKQPNSYTQTGWVSKTYTTLDPPDADLPVVVAPLIPDSLTVIPPSPGDPSALVLERGGVRMGPGLEYPLYGLTATGALIEILGVTHDGEWYALRLPTDLAPNGMAWIPEIFLETENIEDIRVYQQNEYPPIPTDTRPTAPGANAAAAIALDTLNVLSGPDPSYPSLGKVDGGSILGIVGKSADGKYWVISVPTSISASGHGWVDASQVEVSKTGTESQVPVISSP